jgi:phenylacetate-CoA ligase
MNRRRFPVFDLSDENLEHYLEFFKQDTFKYIYGYTSALVLFARYVMENNIVLKEICPSLICCIFTSETASKEDRVLLERAFGVKVYCEYGSSETGIIAFENELGELVVDTKLLYLEEYKYPDGTKTTLVTSLFNKAFPFIRYDIGDIVTIKTTGDKTIITSLEGRTNDIIILPSGKKSAGLTFYYISRSILENSGCLKEFIIRQTKIDTFVFDIVSSRELLESEITIIENEMERYLESNLIVGINYVTSIPRLKNGKLKHFISEI